MLGPKECPDFTVSCTASAKNPSTFMVTTEPLCSPNTTLSLLNFSFFNIPLPHSMAILVDEKSVCNQMTALTTDDSNQAVNGQHLRQKIHHIRKQSRPLIKRNVRSVHCLSSDSAGTEIFHVLHANLSYFVS